MSGGRVGLAVVVLSMALASSSCRLFRRGAKQTPPPPPKPAVTAPVAPPPSTTPKEAPPLILPPPDLPPGEPKISQPPVIQLPQPRPPAPRRRKRPVPKPVPAPVPEPVVEAPKPPTPMQVPQLQQILSPEQQRECNEAIDQSLARAQAALARFNGRRLTDDQAAAVARVRTFILQAEQARKTDLLTARALAERADVLAQDLLKGAP
ncbi:MAG: hypothetical protein AAB225_27215 [Acidobacteriota bacterium]